MGRRRGARGSTEARRAPSPRGPRGSCAALKPLGPDGSTPRDERGRTPSAARSGARSWLGRVALAALSTLASLVLAEVALRLAHVAPERFARSWHLESEDKRFALDVYPDDPRGYFPVDLRTAGARDPFRAQGLGEVDERYERTPFAVPFRFSAELCRGGEIPPRDPARPRVVVIGDSFTEGQGVREDDTFVALLGARIDDAQLVNCGRRGYDFPTLAEWFDRKLALEPDVVVYAMLLNDPQQSEAFHARQAYLDDWILDRRRMYTDGDGAPPPWQPRLFALLEDRMEAARVGEATTRWYQEMVGPPNQEGWDATLAQLERMDRVMRERGGAFVVALWPLMVDLDGVYPFEAAHRTIREALESRHIAFHDTLPAFRGRDPRALWVHPADRHPNEEGHRIFAEALEGPLREILLAQRQP